MRPQGKPSSSSSSSSSSSNRAAALVRRPAGGGSSNNTNSSSSSVNRVPKYGDIDDSDYVHDEIKELGKQVKQQMEQNNPVKDEGNFLEYMRMFGPSKESKAQLRKELDGAKQSIESGIYVVYRNVGGGGGGGTSSSSALVSSSSKTKRNPSRIPEECCRIGASHKCFCSHSLADHQQQQRGGKNQLPPCSLCNCEHFTYIPNQPEEVGDGFLSRRAGFNSEAWSPKCRCGHGAHSHEPNGSRRCRECRGCFGYESQWCCGVCDSHWEEHVTVVENEQDRMSANRATGVDYLPLSEVNPEFREIVFGEEVAKQLPPSQRWANKQIGEGSSSSSLGAALGNNQNQNQCRILPSNETSFQQQTTSTTRSSNLRTAGGSNHHEETGGSIADVISNNNNNNLPPRGSFSSQNNNTSSSNSSSQVQQQQQTTQPQTSSSSNPQQTICTQCDALNRRLAKFCRVCGCKI